ncbi:hypothetical protein K503DRAFT_59502 [Rhizopogon vinicolor AM-OR11-026]|uniref:Uncharacterized protein n=1 Tax=Rhizopogon vinicolor AM-OR11-026 TaxID=1314800 RepID=A0A1B7N4E4_9AGAM|nr:hypothetical protein K503DRAFT_59502 [Rhizopogon vinicolor AM-OR11-026]
MCMTYASRYSMCVCGYTSASVGPAMTIVRPWAWNVNLMAYSENEDKNLTAVRRFQILRDIMARLQYHVC